MSNPMWRISSKFVLGCGLALGLLIPVAGANAKEKVLYSFIGTASGTNPFSGLIMDKTGNLYGTTVEGGADGDGTVFVLAPDGTETVLWSFSGADGSLPEGSLIMDKTGNLYGTTSSGGANNDGTVFELAPDGAKTVLHSFNGADGRLPRASLIKGKKGKLYGTTVFGGAHNAGTVFELAPNGTETVLYSFTGGADGSFPHGSLIMDKTGNLYGTTDQGGTGVNCGSGGCGTVFKLAPHGTETVLHSFNAADGGFPTAGLIQDESGNLYGTTSAGGADGYGAVFKVAPNGTETVLYSFTGGADGSSPQAGLIMDENGNLYSTTYFGGANTLGTVFKLAPDGTETVLYSFNAAVNGTDGFEPYGGLIMDKKGNLYGTTYGGGAQANGTVFKITKH